MEYIYFEFSKLSRPSRVLWRLMRIPDEGRSLKRAEAETWDQFIHRTDLEKEIKLPINKISFNLIHEYVQVFASDSEREYISLIRRRMYGDWKLTPRDISSS